MVPKFLSTRKIFPRSVFKIANNGASLLSYSPTTQCPLRVKYKDNCPYSREEGQKRSKQVYILIK
jgi:hypothetical protein